MQLCDVPLFEGLTEQEAEFFRPTCQTIRHRAGTCLLTHGAYACSIFMVLAGEVTVKVYDEQGMPTMVSVIGPGGMVGWSALIPPHLATATLVALTDVNLLRFDGAELHRLASERPELGLHLMINVSRVISQRLAEARARLTSSLAIGSRHRVVGAAAE